MPAPIISISPGPDAWRSALAEPTTPGLDDRAALGLPTDRPVVMSGHQPVLWHAGILTKLLAMAEIAGRTGSASCWIVADMDEVDPTTLRLPPTHTDADTARARAVRTLAGDPPAPGVPTGALPPRPAAKDDPAIEGLAPLLDAYAFEPTLAMQVGRATIFQACERFGLAEPVVISCSDLINTNAWRDLVGAMAEDPARCVEAYNNAVAAHPGAHMRALQTHNDRFELPLWRVRQDHPRLAVFSDQLASIPPEELRPRALAMTALVRAVLCELFIHGTGGGVYDRITDDWFAHWAHGPAWRLSPTAVATGNAYADLGSALGVDLDTLPDPATAAWRAHHARHDPAMLGDADAARTKRDLVERIASIRAAGKDPAPSFAELQDLLTHTRQRHADKLAGFDAEAERARRLSGLRDLACDRTWPWPTLPDATLDTLHALVRAWADEPHDAQPPRGAGGASTIMPCAADCSSH